MEGFWSVAPYPVWVKHVIIILGCLLFIVYKYSCSIKRFWQKNAGCLSFIALIIALAVGVFYVEMNYCNLEKQYTILEYVLEYAKGMLSTLIGIWVVYMLLRPRLKIYPTFALSRDKEKIYGKILIKNTCLTDLFDLKIVLQGCYVDENGNLRTYCFKMTDEEVAILKNRLYNNENSYAWHTENTIHEVFDAFDYIRCRIIATHSLSGMHFITEQYFQKNDCLYGDYNNKNKFIAK